LHLTHNLKPFVNKARYTPPSASRPERLTKDLANIKRLATHLENEAHALLLLPEKLPEPCNIKKSKGGEIPDESEDPGIGDGDANGDSDMNISAAQESKDRGSIAVEARLSKLFADLDLEGPEAESEADGDEAWAKTLKRVSESLNPSFNFYLRVF
jgi:hypothetical protein